MVISPPRDKVHAITQLSRGLLAREEVTLRDLARIVGTMVAAHPAILPAPLHYHFLEGAKSAALRRGLPYQAKVKMTQDMVEDLNWWIGEANNHNGRVLEIPRWDLVIESDASEKGWGACIQGTVTWGSWTVEEQEQSINYLELLAAFSGSPDICLLEEEGGHSTAP